MKKDFFTDKLGMYGDPDGNFVIPGDLSSTPITTKYLQRPIIATAADGTTKILPPGSDNIRMPSNTVLEMNYQMGAQTGAQTQQQQLMQLISMYCQKVGGGDQSCAQKVAQSLQKNPQQMVQQMMAALQQDSQMQGEEEMAKMGGCIDCQEAFPQANVYPTDWASYTGTQYKFGGMSEAFPQAQTYLPYDRPGENRLNGMFEYGGQTLDQVYQMMKRGGLNYDPKKKKGKQETFEEYQMRMGGLSKYQGVDQSEVDESDYEMPPDETAWSAADEANYNQLFGNDNKRMDPNWLPGASRRFMRKEARRQRAFDRQAQRQHKQNAANPSFMKTPAGPDEGAGYDQSLGVNDGFPTVTLDAQGRIVTPGQQQQTAQQLGQDQRSAFGPGGGGGAGAQGQNPYSNNAYNAYDTGKNFTNMFGNRAGAMSSIIGGGLSAMAGFGSGFGKSKFRFRNYDAKGNRVGPQGRLKGQAADIAASNLFNRYGQPQQQQQQPAMPFTQQVGNQFMQNLKQNIMGPAGTRQYFQAGGNPSMDFKYTTYTGPNEQSMMPTAWSAGVADAFDLNRREEELEKMRMRSTGMSMVPATTAQKTQAGSPQGAINAPSFVPKTTVANFGQDAYMQRPVMNYGQYGGMMMDDMYQDGGEYDLSDMTPQERDDVIRRLAAAGYDIEYLD